MSILLKISWALDLLSGSCFVSAPCFTPCTNSSRVGGSAHQQTAVLHRFGKYTHTVQIHLLLPTGANFLLSSLSVTSSRVSFRVEAAGVQTHAQSQDDGCSSSSSVTLCW